MQRKLFCVYIMSTPGRTVFGMTSNLPGRVYRHREHLAKGFTAKYNVVDLVYYEVAETAVAAITREKQMKAGSRQAKIDLVNSMDPTWADLTAQL